jgi:3-oxoacyl-[acyl-carrier protein] reductase
MDLGLKGLNAIVTGGTKGIGRRAADILAEEGANVAICARNKSEVDAAVAAIGKKGVKTSGQAIDVGDKAALEGWVGHSAKQLGGIDILVANVSALAVDESEEAWHKQFEIDMLHTVRAVTAAIPYLEKSRRCRDARSTSPAPPMAPSRRRSSTMRSAWPSTSRRR